MDVQGLKIGQTWFTATSQSITKYTLEGYMPNRDLFFFDIDGVSSRIENDKFSALDLINTLSAAVIVKDKLKAQETFDMIAMAEEELARLKLERDGING